MRGQSVQIVMKVVMPKPKNIIEGIRMRRAINTAMDMYAENVRVDFEVTTATWRHKPVWTIKSPLLKSVGGAYKRDISTKDKIYAYVSGGTRVRRAVMSMGFRPKSRFRYIGANKGRGGVVFISKKIALPGIKAREFDKAIQEKWQKVFPRLLQDAINTEAYRTNHA